MPPSPPESRRAFDIAIICALSIEADAVHDVFDVFWEREGYHYGSAEGDYNVYTTGVIGEQNVVLAYMPGSGKVSAAAVAVSLRSSFPCISLAFVVGVCGGVPNSPHYGKRIWLGDLIISTSIVQYDFGRQYPASFERKDTLIDNFGRSSPKIRSLLSKLETRHYRKELQNDMASILTILGNQEPTQMYPGPNKDHLYQPSYIHKHRNSVYCPICSVATGATCETASKQTCEQLACEEIHRTLRKSEEQQPELAMPFKHIPHVHFGKIGSADTVMKSGEHRDELARANEIIAFEMEGAGVWDHFPCFVVKGVSDYADSHKRKDWQIYAATVAAAGLKAFLKQWTLSNTSFSSDTVRAMASPIREQYHAQSSPHRAVDDHFTVQPPARPTSENKLAAPSINTKEYNDSKPRGTGSSSPTLPDSAVARTPSHTHVSPTITMIRRRPSAIYRVPTPSYLFNSGIRCKVEPLQTPVHSRVNIVFVHGVLEDSAKPWHDASTGTFWPAESKFWRSNERRTARVFTFGYEVNRVKRINDVYSIARNLVARPFSTDPIILVAHSLGGLVVHAALNLPDHEASQPFKEKVAGIVFFSVPYRDKVAIDHVRRLTTAENIPEAFSEESLDSMFTGSIHKIKTTATKTFWETETTADVLIAGKETCSIGVSTEVATRLPHTNHFTVCKFVDENSSKYKVVGAAIDDLIRNTSFYNLFSPLIYANRAGRSQDDLGVSTFNHYRHMWINLEAKYGSYVGLEEFEEFLQLHTFQPAPRIDAVAGIWNGIIADWTRYGNGSLWNSFSQQVRLPKNLVMSVAYLTYLGRSTPSGEPFLKRNAKEAAKRWEAWTRFDNWIRCACSEICGTDCGTEWNFTDFNGLHRHRNDYNYLGRDDVTSSCVILSTNRYNLPHNLSAVKVMAQNRKSFFESTRQLPLIPGLRIPGVD